MIGLILAAAMLVQHAPTEVSAEARALVAPVAEAIAVEKARQADLPPPTSDRERLERTLVAEDVGIGVAARDPMSHHRVLKIE